MTPAGVPMAKTTLGRHTLVENRSTSGLAPPAVPPDSDRKQPVQIQTGWLFGGTVEPETPNAQDSSA
jgi:hypothetical protein